MRFIDFDISDSEGLACYPAFLSDKRPWPEGSDDLLPMMQCLDEDFLTATSRLNAMSRQCMFRPCGLAPWRFTGHETPLRSRCCSMSSPWRLQPIRLKCCECLALLHQ